MLKGIRRKLTQSINEIEEERIGARFEDLDVVSIAEAPTRVPTQLAGEISGLQVVPRAGSPSLEITLTDGTGHASAVFTGRRRLGGVDIGRRIVLNGVARMENGRMILVNPGYTILE